VIGIGIDLEEVDRFQRMLTRRPHLIDQVFTPAEQEVFRTQREPIVHYAAAFAVKEAMFKALGQGWLESALFWTDIELLSPLSAPSPVVRLSGAALARSRALGGVRTMATLSHGGPFVVAQIVLLPA
jgi:holo-[acyl-carrier protein] synthase